MDKSKAIAILKGKLYNLFIIFHVIDILIIIGEITRIILAHNKTISDNANFCWAMSSLLGVSITLFLALVISIATAYNIINVMNKQVEEIIKKIENSDNNKE